MCPIKMNGTSSWALIDLGNTANTAFSSTLARELLGPEFATQLNALPKEC